MPVQVEAAAPAIKTLVADSEKKVAMRPDAVLGSIVLLKTKSLSKVRMNTHSRIKNFFSRSFEGVFPPYVPGCYSYSVTGFIKPSKTVQEDFSKFHVSHSVLLNFAAESREKCILNNPLVSPKANAISPL